MQALQEESKIFYQDRVSKSRERSLLSCCYALQTGSDSGQPVLVSYSEDDEIDRAGHRLTQFSVIR